MVGPAVKRSAYPRTVWLIEHLPDIWLFAVVTPISIIALLLNFF